MIRQQINIVQNISPSQGVTHLVTLLAFGIGRVGLVIFKIMKLRKSIKITIPTPFPLAAFLKKKKRKKKFLFEVLTKINTHSYNSSSVPVMALVRLVDAGAKSKTNRRQL